VKRGDIVTIADPGGDFSRKPRPAIIVQSDVFNDTHASVTVCLITSHLTGQALFRLPLGAGDGTGLIVPSEIAVDKVQSVWAHRVGKRIGRVSDELLTILDQALRQWLAL